MSGGVLYYCYEAIEEKKKYFGNTQELFWYGSVLGSSPSESFSLYSFWLGRDSDTLLEWPPEPKAREWDHSFLYAG